MKQSDATTALMALAHEHRLSIFRCLIRRGPNGVAAGDIAKALGIAPTNLSFHLKELTNAGLVHSWRDGRFIRYAVEIETMRKLIEFLMRDCCEGHPELCDGEFAGAAARCRDETGTAHVPAQSEST